MLASLILLVPLAIICMSTNITEIFIDVSNPPPDLPALWDGQSGDQPASYDLGSYFNEKIARFNFTVYTEPGCTGGESWDYIDVLGTSLTFGVWAQEGNDRAVVRRFWSLKLDQALEDGQRLDLSFWGSTPPDFNDPYYGNLCNNLYDQYRDNAEIPADESGCITFARPLTCLRLWIAGE